MEVPDRGRGGLVSRGRSRQRLFWRRQRKLLCPGRRDRRLAVEIPDRGRTPFHRHEDFYADLVAGVRKMPSMGTILASPVVVGRVIYVGSTDGYLLRSPVAGAFFAGADARSKTHAGLRVRLRDFGEWKKFEIERRAIERNLGTAKP